MKRNDSKEEEEVLEKDLKRFMVTDIHFNASKRKRMLKVNLKFYPASEAHFFSKMFG